jgi:hypothetical protein
MGSKKECSNDQEEVEKCKKNTRWQSSVLIFVTPETYVTIFFN